MHKLLLIFTGLVTGATLSAQKLPEAVQQLNLDAVREIVEQKKYTEKERVQALQLLAPILLPKE